MRLLLWVIDTAFTLVYWLIIIRVILSWIKPNIYDPHWRKILEIIYRLTEPVLAPIRRLLPQTNLGIDFSPLIAFIVLGMLRRLIFTLLI